mmetsp:Transcript_13321/g.28904  ORF Transcript_13321/g.28904 Transcript_13321/m.28904 type:complete len:247 (-) Transcript_13321:1193-1933(-)
MVVLSLLIAFTRRCKKFHGILNKHSLRRHRKGVNSSSISGGSHRLNQRVVRTLGRLIISGIQTLVFQRFRYQMGILPDNPRGRRQYLRNNMSIALFPIRHPFRPRSTTHKHFQTPPHGVTPHGQDPPRHIHPLLGNRLALAFDTPHPRQYHQYIHIPRKVHDQFVLVGRTHADDFLYQIASILPAGGLDVPQQLGDQIDEISLCGHELQQAQCPGANGHVFIAQTFQNEPSAFGMGMQDLWLTLQQ